MNCGDQKMEALPSFHKSLKRKSAKKISLEPYFPEIERKNHIIIKFKGKWRNKFGHIKKLKGNNTEIVVNYLFKDERKQNGNADD